MAEKIVSPGVFTKEVDQSFLPAGVQAIGAAVIGPTQKGPAGIPTIVSSYSEFVQHFGGKFTSGSGASEQSYKYLTNYAAKEYLSRRICSCNISSNISCRVWIDLFIWFINTRCCY